MLQQNRINQLLKLKNPIETTQQLLREHGIRKSKAALRNAVEIPHENFLANQAVSALSSLGFKASFGNIVKKFLSEYFPLIAFMKDGKAISFEISQIKMN